jgi:hypothetical protein
MEGVLRVSPTVKYADAKRAYLVSLRHKFAKSYQQECDAKATRDRRWVNGFIAAAYHSGLITLCDLKLECQSAYRSAFHERLTKAQEDPLERRLTKLCDQE